ncbi:hypothetical protein OTU49_010587, partial [Cherax quadricarinatus]
PLTQRAKEISAFVTPDGLFQYNVLRFGLKNALATFQRRINTVIRVLDGVQAYLDDIVVFSNQWETHLVRLQNVFECLAQAKLTINLSKSEFGQESVQFLGYVVGQGKVAPINAKVEAIINFPRPQNRKAVMRFLGMVGYYRWFCPNLSQVTSPLTTL